MQGFSPLQENAHGKSVRALLRFGLIRAGHILIFREIGASTCLDCRQLTFVTRQLADFIGFYPGLFLAGMKFCKSGAKR